MLVLTASLVVIIIVGVAIILKRRQQSHTTKRYMELIARTLILLTSDFAYSYDVSKQGR